MTTDITRTIQDGVQTLELARPAKKNALTQAMYKMLSDSLEQGDSDDSIAVHVLLGADGVFTAGNDITDFLAHATGASDGSGLKEVVRFIKVLPNVKKPVLAGVDGAAIGIGTTLLFHCDMVFATPRSVFATAFLDLGLIPEAGSSLLMPQRMGYARAFEMLVMGETYNADQMKAVGLLNAIVEPDDLKPTVVKAAQRLAKKPPEALKISRSLMRGDLTELNARIDEEAVSFAERLSSKEARSAFQAFLNKASG